MFNKRVLFDGASDLSSYKIVETIYDGRQARLLYGGHNTPQSGLALDDKPNLLFDYNQRFLEIALSLRPKKVLVIGGGTFTLPKALLEHFYDIHIDAVELDPLLPQLAHHYFDLPDDERLRIIVDDGRHFLDQAQGLYDLIVIDAFSEFVIPRPLYTVGAVKQYARLLTPDGVLAMNFIAKYKGTKKTLAHELVATFCTGFTAVSLYPADHTYQTNGEENILLVASHTENVPLDYLHSETVELEVMPDDSIVLD
jgi:spermidine synthase